MDLGKDSGQCREVDVNEEEAFRADTVLNGLGTTPHFIFTTSLSGECFHLKEEET